MAAAFGTGCGCWAAEEMVTGTTEQHKHHIFRLQVAITEETNFQIYSYM